MRQNSWRRWINWIGIGALLCATLIVVAACGGARKPVTPAPTTPKVVAPPAIPEKIRDKTDPKAEPTITLYDDKTGSTKPIKMEEYIQGVVAGEMNPKWPVPALAAQAILARTFTLHEIATKGGVPTRGADASTDHKEFQAYAAEEITPGVRQAVEQTKGMVIATKPSTSKPAEYALTWFHDNDGGSTCGPVEGLNYKEAAPNYIKVVRDPYAKKDPKNYNWDATFTNAEIATAAGMSAPEVTKISIEKKGVSGRALTLMIGSKSINAADLRIALGPDKMKSTLLDSITPSGTGFTFKGRGFGHGVGLSQWTASQLAAKGWKPEKIVSYFYKGVSIVKAY